MFRVLPFEDLSAHATIRQTMFRHRASQFVERHRWDLQLTEDRFEIDDFDCAGTSYCIEAEDGRHQASLRLRPLDRGTMLDKAFPTLAAAASDRLRGGGEITRLCASPELSAADRRLVTSDLLLGLCRHCLTSGVERIYGVVFPAVDRVIRLCGWAGEKLSDGVHDGQRIQLVEWTPSELVAWSLQERREELELRAARAAPDVDAVA